MYHTDGLNRSVLGGIVLDIGNRGLILKLHLQLKACHAVLAGKNVGLLDYHIQLLAHAVAESFRRVLRIIQLDYDIRLLDCVSGKAEVMRAVLHDSDNNRCKDTDAEETGTDGKTDGADRPYAGCGRKTSGQIVLIAVDDANAEEAGAGYRRGCDSCRVRALDSREIQGPVNAGQIGKTVLSNNNQQCCGTADNTVCSDTRILKPLASLCTHHGAADTGENNSKSELQPVNHLEILN